MVEIGDIFRIRNPYEDATKLTPHMHMTVYKDGIMKDAIIGTTDINYIVIKKLEFKKANCSPLRRSTYFITDRVYSLENVNVNNCAITNPSRLVDRVLEGDILSSVKYTNNVKLDRTNLQKINSSNLS